MKKIFSRSSLFLILVLATILRFYHLTQISLWHDEAFSATLINYPWKEMFYRIGLDVHPPLYYILLRIWAGIFGHSVLALRGFSATFGVGAVWMGYLVMKQAFKNNAMALATALFLAVDPFQIQYVTEARMYTFGTFIILLSAYCLLKALELERAYYAGNRLVRAKLIRTWLWFALATSAAMYTHYYEFFSVFAIALYALYAEIRMHGAQFRRYWYAISAYIGALLLYVPWVQTFLYQFGQVQGNYWIGKPDRWSVPSVIWAMLTGFEANTANHVADIFIILGVLFTLFILIRVAMRSNVDGRIQPKWLVLSGLVVPFILAEILSLKQSIFLERYFLFAELFYTMAIVCWIWLFKSKIARVGLSVVVVVVLCWANYSNAKSVDAGDKPGMAAAAAFVNAHATPGQDIVVDSSFEYFNFSYYNHTGIAPLLYTGGNPYSSLPAFSGTAILSAPQISAKFTDMAAYPVGATVWLVWTNAYGGYGNTDPNVPANWQLVPAFGEHSWPDVRPYSGTNIYVAEYIIN
jgi:mannosyltransferase